MISTILRKHKFQMMKKSASGASGGALPVDSSLASNLKAIKAQLGARSDLAERKFMVGQDKPVQAALIYLESMTDLAILNDNALKPLMQMQQVPNDNLMSHILGSVLTVAGSRLETFLSSAIQELLKAKSLILVDGETQVIVIDAQAMEQRTVTEPATESTIRGPRAGFVEDINVNLALVRSRLRNSNLQIEKYQIGRRTNTEVCIMYLRGIVKEELVAEVRRRLSSIDIEGVLDSGHIEQWIEDAPFSLFPTVGNTEKPDAVAGKLLDGRVAILVDTTPIALTVPAVFADYFKITEDYYSRPFYSSFTRLLRYVAFLDSIFLPAFYVALENFQKELIPEGLIRGFANAREGVPFPLALEVLMMIVLYEWLREAGVRMPRPIGQAVSIVGSLVIGQAAVSAGIIGAPTVIVIATAAITTFLVPPLQDVSAMFRVIAVLVVSVLGLYGLFLLFYAMLVYLVDLRSFGIPYMTPLAPMRLNEWKDFIFRAPLQWLSRRSASLEVSDQKKRDSVPPPNKPLGNNRG
ncbi:MAG: spore germination protein [Bacilli bacterium]